MIEPTETPRGFHDYADFVDTYGINVRVRESSSAEGPHLWVFTKSTDRPGTPESDGVTHLNVEQAKLLRDAIDYWLNEIPKRWEDGERFLEVEE